MNHPFADLQLHLMVVDIFMDMVQKLLSALRAVLTILPLPHLQLG